MEALPGVDICRALVSLEVLVKDPGWRALAPRPQLRGRVGHHKDPWAHEPAARMGAWRAGRDMGWGHSRY